VEFPYTAVIAAEDAEDAEILHQFLGENGFMWEEESNENLLEKQHWHDGGLCYDIDSDRRVVNYAPAEYYENEFEKDFPNLMPQNPKWFLCSVCDFITMVGGNYKVPCDLDVADDSEITAFLCQ